MWDKLPLSLDRSMDLVGQTWALLLVLTGPDEGLQLPHCSFCLCSSEDATKCQHERFLTNQLLCVDK